MNYFGADSIFFTHPHVHAHADMSAVDRIDKYRCQELFGVLSELNGLREVDYVDIANILKYMVDGTSVVMQAEKRRHEEVTREMQEILLRVPFSCGKAYGKLSMLEQKYDEDKEEMARLKASLKEVQVKYTLNELETSSLRKSLNDAHMKYMANERECARVQAELRALQGKSEKHEEP